MFEQGKSMHHTWRAAALTAVTVAVAATAACSSSSSDDPEAKAAEQLAAAATAEPGEYGSPVDPSLPAPSNVATDAPAVATVAEGTVSISSADWNTTTGSVEVDGLVPDVIESTGTCTLTLTKDGTTVTTSRPGFPDASSTSCAGLAVAGTELSPGTWTAVLSYRSNVSTASSQQVEVAVP
jgi:hypothetical protein